MPDSFSFPDACPPARSVGRGPAAPPSGPPLHGLVSRNGERPGALAPGRSNTARSSGALAGKARRSRDEDARASRQEATLRDPHALASGLLEPHAEGRVALLV